MAAFQSNFIAKTRGGPDLALGLWTAGCLLVWKEDAGRKGQGPLASLELQAPSFQQTRLGSLCLPVWHDLRSDAEGSGQGSPEHQGSVPKAQGNEVAVGPLAVPPPHQQALSGRRLKPHEHI